MSVAEAPAPVERKTGPTPGTGPASDLVRLAVFAALALFCAQHWAALVASPPIGRVLLAVAAATGAGAALVALRRSGLRAAIAQPAAVLVALVAFALAAGAVGLPLRLLWPAHWDELGGVLDRGMTGIRTVVWPYAGDEPDVRLVILLGLAPLVALAGALAFWPAGPRVSRILRALGLVALLCLYGIPVTDHDPGSPLTRGLVLFVLVAAWLWLPRLRRREAVPGVALVGVIALVALPLSAGLDRNGSLIDYSQWNWFGGKEITFNWNHTYGPLNWPRDGTTLLEVKSRRPLYWKAEVLDDFDGLRWDRSSANARTSPLGELPRDPDTRWDRRIEVNVRSLRTDFVIGTGTPYRVSGAGEAISGSADGTLQRLTEPLRRGDTYTVRTYAPTPNAGEMRAAPRRYDEAFGEYTTLSLPGGARRSDRPRVQVPLTGSDGSDPTADRLLERSPYARAFRLSRRLTADQPSVYDAVRNVRDYLRRTYTYSERPPTRRYPLEAFLFRDKIGYCQQFSGAMALLLRMSGIPARVATGFSPGSYNRDTQTYRVRDLDAHSWVEVYFAGIGWVTFDPTPPAAPAERPSSDAATGQTTGQSATGAFSGGDSQRDTNGPSARLPGGRIGGSSQDDGGPPWAVLAGLAALAAAGGAGSLWWRRSGPSGPDGRLHELERALPRLGWSVPGGTTLLELERRLGRSAGPASARYVASLRADRYSPGRGPALLRDRRAMRRELTSSGGPLARLRGFLVLPPGRGTESSRLGRS